MATYRGHVVVDSTSGQGASIDGFQGKIEFWTGDTDTDPATHATQWSFPSNHSADARFKASGLAWNVFSSINSMVARVYWIAPGTTINPVNGVPDSSYASVSQLYNSGIDGEDDSFVPTSVNLFGIYELYMVCQTYSSNGGGGSLLEWANSRNESSNSTWENDLDGDDGFMRIEAVIADLNFNNVSPGTNGAGDDFSFPDEFHWQVLLNRPSRLGSITLTVLIERSGTYYRGSTDSGTTTFFDSWTSTSQDTGPTATGRCNGSFSGNSSAYDLWVVLPDGGTYSGEEIYVWAAEGEHGGSGASWNDPIQTYGGGDVMEHSFRINQTLNNESSAVAYMQEGTNVSIHNNVLNRGFTSVFVWSPENGTGDSISESGTVRYRNNSGTQVATFSYSSSLSLTHAISSSEAATFSTSPSIQWTLDLDFGDMVYYGISLFKVSSWFNVTTSGFASPAKYNLGENLNFPVLVTFANGATPNVNIDYVSTVNNGTGASAGTKEGTENTNNAGGGSFNHSHSIVVAHSHDNTATGVAKSVWVYDTAGWNGGSPSTSNGNAGRDTSTFSISSYLGVSVSSPTSGTYNWGQDVPFTVSVTGVRGQAWNAVSLEILQVDQNVGDELVIHGPTGAVSPYSFTHTPTNSENATWSAPGGGSGKFLEVSDGDNYAPQTGVVYYLSNRIQFGSSDANVNRTNGQLAANNGKVYNRGETVPLEFYMSWANGDTHNKSTPVQIDVWQTDGADSIEGSVNDGASSGSSGFVNANYFIATNHAAAFLNAGLEMNLGITDGFGNYSGQVDANQFYVSWKLKLGSSGDNRVVTTDVTNNLINWGRQFTFSTYLYYARGDALANSTNAVIIQQSENASTVSKTLTSAEITSPNGFINYTHVPANDETATWTSVVGGAAPKYVRYSYNGNYSSYSLEAWELSSKLRYGNAKGSNTNYQLTTNNNKYYQAGEVANADAYLSWANGDTYDSGLTISGTAQNNLVGTNALDMSTSTVDSFGYIIATYNIGNGPNYSGNATDGNSGYRVNYQDTENNYSDVILDNSTDWQFFVSRGMTISIGTGANVLRNFGENHIYNFTVYRADGTTWNGTQFDVSITDDDNAQEDSSNLSTNGSGLYSDTYQILNTHKAVKDTTGSPKRMLVTKGVNTTGIVTTDMWSVSSLLLLDSAGPSPPSLANDMKPEMTEGRVIYNLNEDVPIKLWMRYARGYTFGHGTYDFTVRDFDIGLGVAGFGPNYIDLTGLTYFDNFVATDVVWIYDHGYGTMLPRTVLTVTNVSGNTRITTDAPIAYDEPKYIYLQNDEVAVAGSSHGLSTTLFPKTTAIAYNVQGNGRNNFIYVEDEHGNTTGQFHNHSPTTNTPATFSCFAISSYVTIDFVTATGTVINYGENHAVTLKVKHSDGTDWSPGQSAAFDWLFVDNVFDPEESGSTVASWDGNDNVATINYEAFDTDGYQVAHTNAGVAKRLEITMGDGVNYAGINSVLYLSSLIDFGNAQLETNGRVNPDTTTPKQEYNHYNRGITLVNARTYATFARGVPYANTTGSPMTVEMWDAGFVVTGSNAGNDSFTIIVGDEPYADAFLNGKTVRVVTSGGYNDYTISSVSYTNPSLVVFVNETISVTSGGRLHVLMSTNDVNTTGGIGRMDPNIVIPVDAVAESYPGRAKIGYVYDSYGNYASTFNSTPTSVSNSFSVVTDIPFAHTVGKGTLRNLGETHQYEFEVGQFGGGSWNGTNATVEVYSATGVLEDSQTITVANDKVSGSYQIASSDVAAFNVTGSPKRVKLTISGNNSSQINSWYVSSKLRWGSDELVSNYKFNNQGNVRNYGQDISHDIYLMYARGGEQYSGVPMTCDIINAADSSVDATINDTPLSAGKFDIEYVPVPADDAAYNFSGLEKRYYLLDTYGNTTGIIKRAYFLCSKIKIGSIPGSNNRLIDNLGVYLRNLGETHTYKYYLSYADGEPYNYNENWNVTNQVYDDQGKTILESSSSPLTPSEVDGSVDSSYYINPTDGASFDSLGKKKYLGVTFEDGNNCDLTENTWRVSSYLFLGDEEDSNLQDVDNLGFPVRNRSELHDFKFYLTFARGTPCDLNDAFDFTTYNNGGSLTDTVTSNAHTGNANGEYNATWDIPVSEPAYATEDGQPKDLIVSVAGNSTARCLNVFAVSSLIGATNFYSSSPVYNLGQSATYGVTIYSVYGEPLVNKTDVSLTVFNDTDGVGAPEDNVANETTDGGGIVERTYTVDPSDRAEHSFNGDQKRVRVEWGGNDSIDSEYLFGVSDLLRMHPHSSLPYSEGQQAYNYPFAATTTSDDGGTGLRSILNVGETVDLKYYVFTANGSPWNEDLTVDALDANASSEGQTTQIATGYLYNHQHVTDNTQLAQTDISGSPKQLGFVDGFGNYGQSDNAWYLSDYLRSGAIPSSDDLAVKVLVGSSAGPRADNNGIFQYGIFNIDAGEIDPYLSQYIGYARGSPYANKTLTREVLNSVDAIEDSQSLTTDANGLLDGTYSISITHTSGNAVVGGINGYDSVPVPSLKHLITYDDNSTADSVDAWGLTKHVWVDAHHQRSDVLRKDAFNPARPLSGYENREDNDRGYIRPGSSMHGWTHVMGVRMDREIDTGAAEVTMELYSPLNVLYDTFITGTGADGWTPIWSHSVEDFTSYGDWEFRATVSSTAFNGQSSDLIQVLTPDEAYDAVCSC